MKSLGKTTSYTDLLDHAMKITDQDKADEHFKMLVSQFEEKSEEEAEAIVRQDLGYFAGYYDHATRERVEKLYDASHPILGSASNQLSPKEIFELGKKIGSGEMKIPQPVIKKKKKRKIEW